MNFRGKLIERSRRNLLKIKPHSEAFNLGPRSVRTISRASSILNILREICCCRAAKGFGKRGWREGRVKRDSYKAHPQDRKYRYRYLVCHEFRVVISLTALSYRVTQTPIQSTSLLINWILHFSIFTCQFFSFSLFFIVVYFINLIN